MKKILWFSLLFFVASVSAQTFTNSTKVIGIPTNNVINYSGVTITNASYFGNGLGLTNVIGQYNVKEFGAVGDGITDDSAAVQSAINAGSGRTVFFPVGVYKLTHTITNIGNNTQIKGEGSGRFYESAGVEWTEGTVLKFYYVTNGFYYSSTFGVSQQNNYTDISDLIIDGKGVTENGISMTGCHSIRNVSIINCNSAGLRLRSEYPQMVNSVTIDNCSFSVNGGSGLVVDPDEGNGMVITPYHVKNSIFRRNSKMGADIQSGYLAEFEGCVFEQNGYEGVKLYKKGLNQTLNKISFRDCWFELNSTIPSGTNKNSVVIDSELYENESSPRNIVFDNCYFLLDPDSTGHHFKIKSVTYCDFYQCVAFGGDTSAIFALGVLPVKIRVFDSFIGYTLPAAILHSAIDDIQTFLGSTNPFFVSGGFSGVGPVISDGVQGYGGSMIGTLEQNVGGHLKLLTRNNSESTERLDIGPTGNAVFGRTNSASLTVNGPSTNTANVSTYYMNVPYRGSSATIAPENGLSLSSGYSANNVSSYDSAGSYALLKLQASDISINSRIYPVTDNTIDFGTSSYKYKDGYFGGALSASSISASTLNASTSITVTGPVTNTANVSSYYLNIPYRGTSATVAPENGLSLSSGYSANNIASYNSSGSYALLKLQASDLTINSRVYPTINNSYDLGTTDYRFKDAYFAGDVTADDIVNDSSSVSTLILRGSTSGYTSFSVPATAGSNTIIFPNFAGANGNYLKTDGSGNLTWSRDLSIDTVAATTFVVGSQLILTNGVWDDLQIPGLSVKVGVNAPTFGAFPGQTEFFVYLFGGASTDNDVYFTAQLPHTYKEGTDIIAHVHWFPTTASSSKNIIWTMKYEWKNIGEVINGTANTLGGTAVAVPATAGTHTITSFAAMNGTGKTISSMILCHLKREASNGLDTYPDDAAFLQVDFHYQKDTIGSSSSTAK